MMGGLLTTKHIKCSLVSIFNAVNIIHGSTSHPSTRNGNLDKHRRYFKRNFFTKNDGVIAAVVHAVYAQRAGTTLTAGIAPHHPVSCGGFQA